MKKIISLITLFGLTSLLAVGCNSTPEQRAERMVKMVSSKLDLNKEQEAKLIDLKQAVLDARERQKGEKVQMFQDVKNLVVSEKITEADLKKLMTKKQEIMTEEIPKVFPKFQAFHSSLNPDQKEKVSNFITKMYEKRNGLK